MQNWSCTLRSIVAFLIVFCFSALAEERVQVVPFCLSTPTEVYAFTVVRSSFTILKDLGNYKKGQVIHSRFLLELHCSRSSKVCSGIMLDLDPIDNGKPLQMHDLVAMKWTTLVSQTEKVFVVSSGLYKTFTIDLATQTLQYRESGDVEEGIGIGSCKSMSE